MYLSNYEVPKPARCDEGELILTRSLAQFFLLIAAASLTALGMAGIVHTIYPVVYLSYYYSAISLPLAYLVAIQRRRSNAANVNSEIVLQIETIILLLFIIPVAGVLSETFRAWNYPIFACAIATFFLASAWRDQKINHWLKP